MSVRIIPAILEQEVAEVQKKLNLVRDIASLAQIDIADGQFVDNTTVSLAQLRDVDFEMPVEFHLMVAKPLEHFELCQRLGATRVLWHYEANSDINDVIAQTRTYSFKKGIVLNTETPVSAILPSCDCLDAVMLMGIAPGRQGQAFIEETIDRVRELKERFHGTIVVDGGVSEKNIAALVDAGATDLVIGSALFGAEDVAAQYQALRQLAS